VKRRKDPRKVNPFERRPKEIGAQWTTEKEARDFNEPVREKEGGEPNVPTLYQKKNGRRYREMEGETSKGREEMGGRVL